MLIIFAILMTRDVQQGSPSNQIRIPAAILAALFLLATSFVALNTDWNLLDEAMASSVTDGGGAATGGQQLTAEAVSGVQEVYSNTIPVLARLLLRDYVLTFEVASVLLLAAIIGALALVREH